MHPSNHTHAHTSIQPTFNTQACTVRTKTSLLVPMDEDFLSAIFVLSETVTFEHLTRHVINYIEIVTGLELVSEYLLLLESGSVQLVSGLSASAASWFWAYYYYM